MFTAIWLGSDSRQVFIILDATRVQAEKERLEAERLVLSTALEGEKSLVNQLAAEADTIPTYIKLYHDQRKVTSAY